MKNYNEPSLSELEILQIIWSDGPSSVRKIHEKLSEKRKIFYTTTLKTMQNMTGKGLLSRDTSQRSHIYAASVLKAKIQTSMLDKFASTVFNGSTGQLIISAMGNKQPDQEELDEIKLIINQMERNDNL